jgi:hypothetical protein
MMGGVLKYLWFRGSALKRSALLQAMTLDWTSFIALHHFLCLLSVRNAPAQKFPCSHEQAVLPLLVANCRVIDDGIGAERG